MSQEQFEMEVEEFFAKTKYPKLDVPIGQVVYQLMIELLDFLRAKNFLITTIPQQVSIDAVELALS
jgi:hypothetical protein